MTGLTKVLSFYTHTKPHKKIEINIFDNLLRYYNFKKPNLIFKYPSK